MTQQLRYVAAHDKEDINYDHLARDKAFIYKVSLASNGACVERCVGAFDKRAGGSRYLFHRLDKRRDLFNVAVSLAATSKAHSSEASPPQRHIAVRAAAINLQTASLGVGA